MLLLLFRNIEIKADIEICDLGLGNNLTVAARVDPHRCWIPMPTHDVQRNNNLWSNAIGIIFLYSQDNNFEYIIVLCMRAGQHAMHISITLYIGRLE